MDQIRYLECDKTGILSKEEVEEGWHFCPDYDFMLCLVGTDGCTCGRVEDA